MTTPPKRRGSGPSQMPTTAFALALSYVMWIAILPAYLGLWAFARIFKRVPDWLLRKLLRDHYLVMQGRRPDVRIPFDPGVRPYMLRWWRIKRNPYFNVYYHRVLRSDEDRALHDHPWWNFSIVLTGGYFEHVIKDGGVHEKTFYPAGSVRFRPSGTFAHRLELKRYSDGSHTAYMMGGLELPAETIFITGPVLRRWGFHAKQRWVDAYEWDQFCTDNNLQTGMTMAGYNEGPKA